MSWLQDSEKAEDRLAAIRGLAVELRDSSDDRVWSLSMTIEQLCIGSITVTQAYAQTED